MAKYQKAIEEHFEYLVGDANTIETVFLLLAVALVCMFVLSKSIRASGGQRYSWVLMVLPTAILFMVILLVPPAVRLYVRRLVPAGFVRDWLPLAVTLIAMIALFVPLLALICGVSYLESLFSTIIMALACGIVGFAIRTIVNTTGRVGGDMRGARRRRERELQQF